MSKLFDMLHRTKGEIAEVVLPIVEAQIGPPPQAIGEFKSEVRTNRVYRRSVRSVSMCRRHLRYCLLRKVTGVQASNTAAFVRRSANILCNRTLS